MEYVGIPGIDTQASRIGLGTWAMGGVGWTGSDDSNSVRTIHAALDQGINVIDTAPAYGYGHSEEIVGTALAKSNRRGEAIIATKVGLSWQNGMIYRDARRQRIVDEVEASLKRLKTDYIDLYQVHWPDSLTPIGETAEAMVRLQRQGKIRAIGVSNFSINQMKTFREVAPLTTAQPPYNLFERALCRGLLTGAIDERTPLANDDLRNGDPKFGKPRLQQYVAAEQALDQLAQERWGKGVLPLAIRWVLDQPGVSIALWGAKQPGELDPVDGVSGWRVDDEAARTIEGILRQKILDPVGPEFMAPPTRPDVSARSPQPSPRQ